MNFLREIKLTGYPGDNRQACVIGLPSGTVALRLHEGHLEAHTYLTPAESVRLGRALLHAAEGAA